MLLTYYKNYEWSQQVHSLPFRVIIHVIIPGTFSPTGYFCFNLLSLYKPLYIMNIRYTFTF